MKVFLLVRRGLASFANGCRNFSCRTGLGLAPGETAVVTNGRVLTLEPRPGSNEPVFVAEDYELLEMYARQNQFATSELAELVAEGESSKLDNEALAVISSILASQPLDQARRYE